MTSSTIDGHNLSTNLSKNLKNGLLGGGIAAVLSLVLFFIGDAVAGPIEVALQPGAPLAPLPWIAVVMATLVPAIVGALLLSGLQRTMANGTRIFQITAVVITLLSLFPAITQAGSTGAAVLLSLLHFVAAGAIVWALTLRA